MGWNASRRRCVNVVTCQPLLLVKRVLRDAMGVNYEAECCCLICIVCDARSSARTPFLCECMQPESHDVVQLFAVFRWVPNGALHMSHKSQATCRALTRVYDTMTNDMPKRADDEKEILEVIDDGMGGSPVPHLVIDYVPRGTIHTKGLLHSAFVSPRRRISCKMCGHIVRCHLHTEAVWCRGGSLFRV